MDSLPRVTVVFLVFNRCAELRTSLTQMTSESDYPQELVDFVVVDNASTDGSGRMVREEFPQVRLIERSVNAGVSAINDGFAVAEGEYVLGLDDDCYLPADGLRRAVLAAREHAADLVSFSVTSSTEPGHLFTEEYRTGLLSFWGCAVLVRRDVIGALHGYDPEIFVWANELEFTMRVLDAGFRHLHLPDVVAIHMKSPQWEPAALVRSYKLNSRHFAYIAAKLLRPRDLPRVAVSLLLQNVSDGLLLGRMHYSGIPQTLIGLMHGLRRRAPLRNAQVSKVYAGDFHSFANPLRFMRPARVWAATIRWNAGNALGRTDQPSPPFNPRHPDFLRQRSHYYPDTVATLQFSDRPIPRKQGGRGPVDGNSIAA